VIREIANRDRDEAQWMAVRAEFISASDVSAILGANRYKSRQRLLDERLGRVERKPFSASQLEHIQRGQRNEAQLIADFDATPNSSTFVNDEYPWLAATPDGFKDGAVVEIKSSTKELDDVFLLYKPQVITQCIVMAAPYGWLAVGLNEIEGWAKIEPTAEEIEHLLRETKAFYDEIRRHDVK
jgi:putative phage-type endonuclease